MYSYKYLHEAKNLFLLNSKVVDTFIERNCVWIYGKPGIGKSYYVRKTYGDCYMKPQNKWFDGYLGQDVMLMDDFDKVGSHLGHYLKIWADNYSFTAEVKGSSIQPTYTKFFITSNYLPKDIFGEDESLVEAIERRFKIMTINNKRELVDWPIVYQPPMIIDEFKGSTRRTKMEIALEKTEHWRSQTSIDFSDGKNGLQEEQIEEELKIDYFYK